MDESTAIAYMAFFLIVLPALACIIGVACWVVVSRLEDRNLRDSLERHRETQAYIEEVRADLSWLEDFNARHRHDNPKATRIF